MTNHLILHTKLNRPKCFQAYFKRPYLHNKLDNGLQLPLTLITAGASYGKSTLVSQ
jgi:ATP/maltotriose-dependent transcriptional regulator MalT